MTHIYPAMKVRMGSTEYYVVTMKGKDVADRLRIAQSLEDWDALSLDQKYQREINELRVKRDIAPYLARDEDRFFGSLIIAVQNAEEMEYQNLLESLPGIAKTIGPYKKSARDIGFLTMSGDEILIPIDGQHRAKALNYAIHGKTESAKDGKLGFTPNPNVAKDDVTLILIDFDTDDDRAKARRIFSKVNKYAKKNITGRGPCYRR